MNFILIAAAAASQQQAPIETDEPGTIVVTASREPVAAETAPVSATIFDRERLEALALPFASDVIRLAPGVSVSASGPKGTYTELRIRGAEANHSLLFVDGIRFNDPATGNQVHFELFTSDALSRVELVRGPQSALWGSEALGGVVAMETADPFRDQGFHASAEYGGLDTVRGSAQFAERIGTLGLSGSAGWLSSDGIDSFGGDGDRDGFENRSANFKAVLRPLPALDLGITGHWIEGASEFDGLDPVTFRRADTRDSTDNSLLALRAWGQARWNGWSLLADASILDSENRNRLDDVPLNDTFGQRISFGGQVSKESGGQRLTGAVEYEEEDFRAQDVTFGGFTDQQRARSLTAFAGEWRAIWSPRLTTGLAVRHDDFSAFEDATTLRASALFRPLPQWSVHIAYGQGIAQPTFYDLFGFFPGSFVGNPGLKPERSEGWEAGLKWHGGRASASIAGFSNRLRNEIIDVMDPATFLFSTANAEGKSRRRGIELAADYRFSEAASLSFNYSYLDAGERQVAGGAALRETRRPRHSANALLTGSSGALKWGASLAYVGRRIDTDFDLFPAPRVELDDYLLGSLKLGYRLSPALEAYARVENALDADYQDVIGYNTPGRTVYAGLRARLGR